MNMYVFYDEYGDIKAITPSQNDFNDKTCSVTTFPLSEVEPFLLGKQNTFNYEVKTIKTAEGENIVLNKKISEIDYTRTLDNYLTEIGNVKEDVTLISIINKKSSKVISIELSDNFKLLYTNDSVENKNIIKNIIHTGKASIYLTKKHNPYHLLFNITFSPRELHEKKILYFNYTNDIENASAYTKKIINEYGYKEIIL